MADFAAQALHVVETLRDPATVAAATTTPGSLASGLAGTALLHACLSHHDPTLADAATRHWQLAAQLTDHAPDGIYTGTGALAASLLVGLGYLPDSRTHRHTAARAAQWLSARAEGLAKHQQQRTRPGAPWAVYDTIKGLAGIGRVLLAAAQAGHAADAGLTAALRALTTMIVTPHSDKPGWWLPAADHPIRVHPDGAATTGLAHGIAGPLTLLALAHTARHTVPRQLDAIHTAAYWLVDNQEPEGTWPPRITAQREPGRRHAWCYGTPGIASALTHAAAALNDLHLRHAADHALDELATRDASVWDTEGPTLCHGTAGVLHTSNTLGHSHLTQRAAQATAAFFDSTQKFGFAHHEQGQLLHDPGFLVGAAGTALALAHHAGLIPRSAAANWDCLLLLS